jgi:dolichyl-phosphate beta-glucosyltransferase
MTNTTVIVPCHNEAQRLQRAEFRRFVAHHPSVSFLFVNDGSTDATLNLLNEMAAADSVHFSVLHLAKNCGKAEAVRQGVEQAAHGTSKYLGYWDADLATPLDAIPVFMAALDRLPQIEIVIGTRLRLAGRNIQRKPLRRVLGALFSRVTGFVVGARLRDTQCGAKLFRNSADIRGAFSSPFGSRWIFDVELIARLMKLRVAEPQALQNWVYEMPLDLWQDVVGSKLKRGDFVKAIGELASIWWRYLRPGAPQFPAAEGESEFKPAADNPSRRAA